MKEQMTYVAIDADNVGESVGNAVLNNDTETLSSISEGINASVHIFSQWAEHNGGKVISNGSDEAIVQVPVSSIKDLEQLKAQYQEKSGFAVSIGIGETISESAKALIYAKMNGKDQIMDYSPEMEQAMKQSISGELQESTESVGDQIPEESLEENQIPEEDGQIPEHEQELSPEDKALHDSTEEMSDEEEIGQEQLADQAEDQLSSEFGEEESEFGNEEYDDEDNFSEEETAEEALDEMVESNHPSDEDIDLDGVPDEQEEHGEIEPSIDDIDNDGDVEHEEAMAAEAGEEETYSDEGDFSDEVNDEELSESIESEMMDEEMGEEMPGEEMPGEEMPGEEMPGEEMPGEEMPGEEMMVDEQDHESLKNVIYESLQNFKQNRDYLESISHENPELYQGLIHCLQAMIEMARELGYGDIDEELSGEEEMLEDDGDMLDDEEYLGEEAVDEDENLEAQLGSEEIEEENGEDEEFPIDENEDNEEEENSEDENENPFEKNEAFIRLMTKMNQTFSKIKLLKDEDIQDIEALKEKVKKKIAAQKGKKKTSKRKKATKKPKISDKKDKKKGKKESSDGSFCAKSHNKMRASGKDCRANEDKDSPLCSARRKFNCRGKNEEKNKKMDKTEISKAEDKDFDEWHSKASEKHGDEYKDASKHGKEQLARKLQSKASAKGGSKFGHGGIHSKTASDSPMSPHVTSNVVSLPKKKIGAIVNAQSKKYKNKYRMAASESSEYDLKKSKTEKLSKFLKKKDKDREDLEKSKLATKRTTRHVTRPHNPEGTRKGYKVKVVDNETGIARWEDGSRGFAKDPNGDPVGPGGLSPTSVPRQKVPKTDKV